MEEEDERDFLPYSLTQSPFLVSLAPFASSTTPQRRLSSHFTPPSRPVSANRRLAWLSLQGRLIDLEEASSASAIKGGLSRDEAMAWQLFTPIERFLIVAVIGVAVAESRKNRVISQLQKSVEFRDQVLQNMQQKLDNLCEQLYVVKEDQPGTRGSGGLSNRKVESQISESFGQDKINFIDCGCWLCDQHHAECNRLVVGV